MTRYFEYGDEAIEHLKARDAKLARAIDAVGHVRREMDDPDLFTSMVHTIIGQQVSTAAQQTVWARVRETLGEVTPSAVTAASDEQLQSCGMTFKKTGYIKGIAATVQSGDLDLSAVERMGDDEAIATLSTQPGIGTWTAEMLLLFCLGRPDILSFGDLGIHRGMRMVYHHRKVTRAMFEKYRRRYSPYGSVASLYLWAVSHGNVPGYDRDYAPMTEAQKKAAKKKRASTKGRGSQAAPSVTPQPIDSNSPLLVSACLLGHACRYDGKTLPCSTVEQLAREHELIPICPEQLGGLPTPRTPSEIQPDGRVVDSSGADRTSAFQAGALRALKIARNHGCATAVLKENSPSCGVNYVYDGTFTGSLVPGRGKTAGLLAQAGIEVLSEADMLETHDARR